MDKNILYLECYSGISGDMTVAALLDLGADQQVLLEGLKSLKVDGYKIEIGRKLKNSIDACDFNVILDEDFEAEDNNKEHHHHDHNHEDHAQYHSHDHAYHDHDHHHSHDHENHNNSHHHELQEHNHYNRSHEDHNHSHHHRHDHEDYNHLHHHDQHDNNNELHDEHHKHHLDHDHDTHQHTALKDGNVSSNEIISRPNLVLGHHEHRNLTDINQIIDQSGISDSAKQLAKKIFIIIAVAESKAHAKPLDQVHFHEVGAIDSIVDIVAAAICLDNLNIHKVIVSELYEGTGQIKCQHGLLPIPVPGVSNISAEYNLPLHITNVKGELVTPTGAAIIAAIKTDDVLPSEMKIKRIGLGAGKRNYPGTSGLLRAMLIEESTKTLTNTSVDHVWVMEANIDDCSGEMLAFAMELLLQNGAKDVYYAPIFMKKNRPAYLLGVICSEDKIAELERIIFVHTTTIGIRKHKSERTILPRVQKTVMTPYGEAIVKVCNLQNETFIYPEYESVKNLCQITGKDYFTLYHEVVLYAHNNL